MTANDVAEFVDEKKHYKQLDADFKRAVHNTDILSNVVSKLVSELESKDIGFIKKCVSPEEMPRIPGLNTEMHNDDDEYVIMDNLFSIDIPGEQEIGIMLNIEAQGDPEPGYPILKRGLYYASGIVFNQKGTVFKGIHYEKLRKTYSIWFVMQPKPGDENSIYRYPLVKIHGIKKKKTIAEDCDLLEIIVVNLGGSENTGDTTLRMFNEIFASRLKGESYRSLLKEKYNITLDDSTLESLERISMSLGEEIVNYQRRVGYNKGHDEGYSDGYSNGYSEGHKEGHKEGFSEGRDKGFSEGRDKGYESRKNESIDHFSNTIIKLMKMLNISIDEASELTEIPEDIKDDVISKVKERISQ